MKTKKRIVLGITGGIASGKSTVVRMMARSGIPVISSDPLAHECMRRGHPSYGRILRHFGEEILAGNREIDRRKLGAIVFANRAERKRLEQMVHPCVVRGLKRFIGKHHGVIALEIPLLFEARLARLVDQVIVVYCSTAEQVRRLMTHKALTRREAVLRLRSQMSLKEKRRRADKVLLNQQTVTALRRHVKKLLTSICSHV